MKKPRTIVAAFGNRIVRTGTVRAGDLLGNEWNWRIHPHEQETVLTGILQQIGFVQGVIINLRTNMAWKRDRHVETMIDGHLRAKIALERGEDTTLPAMYVDLDPDEERAVLLSLDPIGAMAHTDYEKRDALVEELPDDLKELTAILRQERKVTKQVSFEASTQYRIVVTCESEADRSALLRRLVEEGYVCHAD